MIEIYYGNQTLPTNSKILAKIESEDDILNNPIAVNLFENNSKYEKKILPSLKYAKRNGWKFLSIVEIVR